MAQIAFTRSVSTWSLHRTLGGFVAENSSPNGGRMMRMSPVEGGISLLELPAELVARGYQAVQICHFHLASTDDAYLDSLREALGSHGIELDVLLVDAGDVTADDAEHQMAWIRDWIAVAARLGARRARVCAGESRPTPEVLEMSGARLASLAKAHPGTRLLTENWKELTPDGASTLAVLNAAGGQVGLMIDLGNWTGAQKYDDLIKIAPRAEASHVKCHFDARGLDEADFRQSLSILRDAGYTGSLCMIYDGPDADEWRHLDWEWEVTRDVFGIAPRQATG